VVFNERHRNWTNTQPVASIVYNYRAHGTNSQMGPADGTNFFDLNDRGPVTTLAGSVVQPLRVPTDSRIGAVYATGVGGATQGGTRGSRRGQWTIPALDCGTVADKWAGFTLRNATLAPAETVGGQVGGRGPVNTWTMIHTSSDTPPCTLTVYVGAAASP